MNLNHIFKGLEFVGALVAATSIATLPEDELEKLKEQLGLSNVPQLTEKQDEKAELNHDLTAYSEEERAAIEKYLKSMEENR